MRRVRALTAGLAALFVAGCAASSAPSAPSAPSEDEGAPLVAFDPLPAGASYRFGNTRLLMPAAVHRVAAGEDWVAAGDVEGWVRVFDLATGAKRAELRAGDSIQSLASRGDVLFAGTGRGELLALEVGATLTRLDVAHPSASGYVGDLTLDRSGTRVMTALTTENEWSLCPFVDRRFRPCTTSKTRRTGSATMDPTGELGLFRVEDDVVLRPLEPADAKPIFRLSAARARGEPTARHRERLRASRILRFAPDGSAFVAAGEGRSVTSYATSDGALATAVELPDDAPAPPILGERFAITDLAFDRAGKHLFAASNAGRLYALTWPSLALEAAWTIDTRTAAALALVPGRPVAVLGAFDRRPLLFDLEKAAPVFPESAHTRRVSALAATDDLLAGGVEEDTTLALWRRRSRRLLTRAQHRSSITALSAVGPRLAVGDMAGVLSLHELPSLRLVQAIPTAGSTGGLMHAVSAIATTPDRTRLATSNNYRVQLFENVPSRELPLSELRAVVTFDGPEVTLAPDGRWLAHSGNWSTVEKLDLTDELGFSRVLGAAEGHVRLLHVLASSKLLVASSEGVYLAAADRVVPPSDAPWDERPRPPLLESSATLHLAPNKATAAALSPREDLLALGLQDGSVALIEVRETLALRETRPAHEGWVTALAFAPDGRTLYSGATDGTILEWPIGQSPGR